MQTAVGLALGMQAVENLGGGAGHPNQPLSRPATGLISFTCCCAVAWRSAWDGADGAPLCESREVAGFDHRRIG